jgi:POT family proton-dependent oligopeptide transporter
MTDLSRIPRSLFTILPSETAERFSFYGAKAILPLYLTHKLKIDEDDATTVVHSFIFLSYAFAVVGGWLADTHWGKYKTILNLSIVYCVGSIMMAITASFPGQAPWGCFGSLFLIALGTGGIKPCVSSFVGDQFIIPGQESMLEKVFGAFYLSINLGSLISMAITPVLHEKASYAAAFGLTACVLGVATLTFWLGNVLGGGKRYRKIPPSGENLIPVVFHIVVAAVKNRRAARRSSEAANGATVMTLGGDPVADHSTSSSPPPFRRRDHWLDYARGGRFDPVVIDGVIQMFKVFKVFAVLPVFWALYDQHSSRWVFQAEKMDRRFGKHFEVTADQVPVLNPLLVLILVPLFHKVIYPAMERRGVPFKPLARMAAGMILAALSYFAAALVQSRIDAGHRPSVLLQIPQLLLLTAGEVLLSVTGLEFAFTQAPGFLKGVIMASWLLTTAVGNLIVIGAAQARLSNLALEFCLFGALMLVTTVVFVYITWNFQYKPPANTQDSGGLGGLDSEHTPLATAAANI